MPTNPFVAIDAQALIIWKHRNLISKEELGQAIDDIAAALQRRDFEAVRKYPFTGRIILGVQCRPAIPADVRARVLSIGYCVKCGSTLKLEVDHIVPYSKGGAHDESNFQCLCQRCNRVKNAKMEEVPNG